MEIYVGNLPYAATEEEIKEFFSAHGQVTNVRIIMDKETGRSKGFAFVEMPDNDEATTAIEASEGAEFLDRNLRVNEAKVRENNNSRGGSRGGGGNRGRNGGGGNRGRNGGGGNNRREANGNCEGGNRSGGNRESGGNNRREANGNREGGNQVNGNRY